MIFRLYALNEPLAVAEGTSPVEIVAAISAVSFATTELTGTVSA